MMRWLSGAALALLLAPMVSCKDTTPGGQGDPCNLDSIGVDQGDGTASTDGCDAFTQCVAGYCQPMDATSPGGGSGDCSANCPSTCGGNVPEQACYYCQAACLCDCDGDSNCAQQNRASAQSLGTTCP